MAATDWRRDIPSATVTNCAVRTLITACRASVTAGVMCALCTVEQVHLLAAVPLRPSSSGTVPCRTPVLAAVSYARCIAQQVLLSAVVPTPIPVLPASCTKRRRPNPTSVLYPWSTHPCICNRPLNPLPAPCPPPKSGPSVRSQSSPVAAPSSSPCTATAAPSPCPCPCRRSPVPYPCLPLPDPFPAVLAVRGGLPDWFGVQCRPDL